MQEMRRANLSTGDCRSRLLHHRVTAVVERDGRDNASALRFVDQALGLRGVDGQRFIGDDVLSQAPLR